MEPKLRHPPSSSSLQPPPTSGLSHSHSPQALSPPIHSPYLSPKSPFKNTCCSPHYFADFPLSLSTASQALCVSAPSAPPASHSGTTLARCLGPVNVPLVSLPLHLLFHLPGMPFPILITQKTSTHPAGPISEVTSSLKLSWTTLAINNPPFFCALRYIIHPFNSRLVLPSYNHLFKCLSPLGELSPSSTLSP